MTTRALVLGFLVAGLGCDQPVEPASAELTEPTAPEVAEPEVAPPPRETVEVPIPEGAPAGLAEAGEALGEALEAGVGVEDGTPCEAAYSGAMAMIQALEERTGQAGEGTVPDREAYVEACSELPPAAQQCMVLSYALEHGDECQRWRTDPQVLALRDRLATAPSR